MSEYPAARTLVNAASAVFLFFVYHKGTEFYYGGGDSVTRTRRK